MSEYEGSCCTGEGCDCVVDCDAFCDALDSLRGALAEPCCCPDVVASSDTTTQRPSDKSVGRKYKFTE